MRVLFLLLLVSGCATPEERAVKAMERYGPYCEAFGMQRGSSAWTDCILTEERTYISRPRAPIYQHQRPQSYVPRWTPLDDRSR
jgi:hypothetical protein